jgi:hypothetical protein
VYSVFSAAPGSGTTFTVLVVVWMMRVAGRDRR